MGCNCKATEKIIKIHKEYGRDIAVPWSDKLKFRVGESCKIILAMLIALFLSPIIFIVLIVLACQGKTVLNINKLLRKLLRHNKNE